MRLPSIGTRIWKNITLRYVLGLSGVALLSILGQLYVQIVLDRQEIDSGVLSAAFQQRILGTRISREVVDLELSSSIQLKPETLVEITSVLAQISAQETLIRTSTKKLANTYMDPANIERHISRLEKNYNDLNQELTLLLNGLGSLPPGKASKLGFKNRALIQAAVEIENAYRENLNLFTLDYQGEAHGRLERLRSTEFLFLAFILILLLTEGLFVFRPVVQQVDASFREIEQSERELIEAKDQAEQALRTRSDFMSRMSHEIRNPMNIILSMSDLLSESVLTAEQKKYTSILRRSGRALLAFINDILDFSKLEAGRLSLNQESFDIGRAIEDSVDLIAAQADEKGLDLLIQVGPGLPALVSSDRQRIQQILLNLLQNSLKFTEKGYIQISTQRKDRTLSIAVKDTGIGIPPEIQDQIFDSFIQADSTVTRRTGGTGLGLTICRQLVTLMGGKISVESQLGVGSTFTVEIPLKVIEEQAKWNTHLEKKVRALVVQSGADFLKNTTQALVDLGADVEATDSLEKALLMLKSEPVFDVVFVDEKIRDSSGNLQSGLSWMREHRQEFSDHIYVVLCISILDAQKSIQASPSSGVDQCLFHPLKPSELLEAMSSRHATTAQRMPEIAGKNAPPSELHDSVLVVDDSVDNQTVMHIYLKTLFNRIEFASNGQEALEALERRKPNLVFMDIQMPVMDGFTAIAAIRAKESGSPLPVIALTAFTDEAEKQSCLRAGFTSHLSKPVSKRAINEAVRSILGQLKPVYETRAMQDSFDSLLADLVPRYLSKRAEEAQLLLKHLQDKNFEQISQIGHKLKGNGATYGFPQLSALGIEMEKWAKEENVTELKQTLREFSRFVEAAQSRIRH